MLVILLVFIEEKCGDKHRIVHYAIILLNFSYQTFLHAVRYRVFWPVY